MPTHSDHDPRSPQPVVCTVEARTHGRVLVQVPSAPPPWPMLLGFHGYAENAAMHLDALNRIPGADRWLRVAVQALHPFYTRQDRVVANWMTRDDRDLAIADNLDYVGRALAQVRAAFATQPRVVFLGFSQGGAMAWRAAARFPCEQLIVLAADVPPDVVTARPASWPRVLIGRGTADEWYTEPKMAADLAALAPLGVTAEACVFEGGHEWGHAFLEAAGAALDRADSGQG